MGDRLRAAEEAAADQAPAAPIIRPTIHSNRATADKLRSGPQGPQEVRDLSGLAGNRQVTHWLKPEASTPAAAPPPLPPIDWIESLPGHVKQQIDNFSPGQEKLADAGNQGLIDARKRNRVTFMQTMRWAMGNDEAVIRKHFEEIQPINVGGGELWGHVSTRERLLEVKADLEAQGIPMPQTTVGLGMRGDHLDRGDKGRGWFTHAVGFAVDWRAYSTPKIADQKLITLFEVVTGGRPDMRTSVESDKRIDLEIKIGQGTADAVESKKLLDSVESEYKRLADGSEKFKTDLPVKTLDRLRELEQARVAARTAQLRLTKLSARRPKATKDEIEAATKAVTDAKERHAKLQAAVEAELPELFEPWIAKVDEKIAVVDRKFTEAGVDVELLTSDYGFAERNKKIQAKNRKAGKATGDEATRLRAEVQELKDDLAKRRKYRADKTVELGGGAEGKKKIDTLIDDKFELMTLKGLKDGLEHNTGGFVFRSKLDVNDPAVDQLLGLMPEMPRGGFFTPDEEGGEKEAKAGKFSGEHGYGLAFIKSMVEHGFEPGMAWRGGSDPMHFELAEGRKFLTSAGVSPVVAGATLRAKEIEK
ncbi:hypothetical protein GCM10010172_50240 [Paractinoplanes ferrugineus]|uniref:Uncharacterized protein n=1 Tax=Paractinoplanes ferrugineus TaxID=113564 RepID=A0A919JAK4_9ACTN|nr:hypothetical protein [Actinoplanes ferrugineus]GIE15714.1 hypothetical protein Afe05nite_75540 [Actinoplanes ferrugineus]